MKKKNMLLLKSPAVTSVYRIFKTVYICLTSADKLKLLRHTVLNMSNLHYTHQIQFGMLNCKILQKYFELDDCLSLTFLL